MDEVYRGLEYDETDALPICLAVNPRFSDSFSAVLVSLLEWQINRNDHSKARSLIHMIKTPQQKNIAIELYLTRTGNKEDCGALFDEITDKLKKTSIAEKLSENRGFTARLDNFYSLLLALEDDPEKLSSFFSKMIKQHPDSQIISIIYEQFVQQNTEGIDAIIDIFIHDPVVTENTLGLKKLPAFGKKLHEEQDKLKKLIIKYLISEMLSSNLLDEEGGDCIKQHFNI
jgi:hypothetical protein